MSSSDFTELPAPLQVLVEQHWKAFCDSGQLLPDELVKELPRVWAGSDYVAEQMTRRPDLVEWLAQMADGGALDQPLDDAELRDDLQLRLQGCEDEAALQSCLRIFRHYHMARIIWRDLAGRADFSATVADLSLLADALISASLDWLYQVACKKDGTPTDSNGDPVHMVVLAMGKLGARELNLSSDIDLIFVYEHEGEVVGGREISHHQFFLRLGQQLIKALDPVTEDGFVFRVDMRLRPWGKSGALAIGFDAIEGYYEEQGREWERYALIKMRPVAGDLAAGERLYQRLVPFIYRRYIDYGVFESLREMKMLIEREVNRKGMQDNVKLGRGGIREAEFIVQVFQLIRGGQDLALRDSHLLTVIPRLVELGLLESPVATALAKSYVFLRDVEHRLQAVADRQTQKLPSDPIEWQRLSWSMGFLSVEAFTQALDEHRKSVRKLFSQVVADPEKPASEQREVDAELLEVWLGLVEIDSAAQVLADRGMTDALAVAEQLQTFRDSRVVSHMQAIGRERLDRLMPLLIDALASERHGEESCSRLLRFLEAVARRSAYIALLVENPMALKQLIKLSAASPWIADQLTRHPVLLDELLDVGTLYAPPNRAELDDELRQQMLRVPEDDLELQMESLRTFKQAHLLRVAASEVTESLPLMKVSDYLTWLAESILNEVLKLAWAQLVDKHGKPSRDDGQPCDPDFVIVGYGKLGGIELSYNSDLDVVFLHDAAANGMTDGEREVPNETFFARLGQRIIHILTTRTMSGQLYEVDVRLRPSGTSGLLVSSLQAYEKYQVDTAWTWEHQALVRARVVAGCRRASEKFATIRLGIMQQHRDPLLLQADVRGMREKMIGHKGQSDPLLFDLKNDAGGIVDIEFVVQYAALRWASEHSALTSFTDNMRLLDTLDELKLMPAEQADQLREAYLAYRSAAHRLALRQSSSLAPAEPWQAMRENVRAIWDAWFVS